MKEGLPEGAYRLEIYACVQSVIKRDLTDAEHKYLSHVLKLYANTARENVTHISKQEPLKHIWTCDNCKTEVIKTGMKENKPMAKKAERNKREIKNALQKKEEAQQG